MAVQDAGLMQVSPLRHHWSLAPDLVFLNHGSFGACPVAVLKRQNELRREMEASPVEFLHRGYDKRMDRGRRALAALLRVRAQDLAPVTNATTAVNAVVKSWPLQPGDEILTTSHDYNACRNALRVAARAAGARVVVAELPFPVADPGEVVAAVLGAVSPRTRFAMIDHISSTSALVFPAARIAGELEQRGIAVLIDGAHVPGMVDATPAQTGASWYTGNLHKWVCAPKGCAFLWTRADRQKMTRPAVTSHGENTPRPGHTPYQDAFDWWGTHDPTPWMCLPETLAHLEDMAPGGWPEIRLRNHRMACGGRAALCEALAVEPPCPEEMTGSMAAVPLPARFQTPGESGLAPLQRRLYDEYRIEVPFTRVGGIHCVRISAHLHNCEADYLKLAEALAEAVV